jgi:Xaa-Pro aminopeptidase
VTGGTDLAALAKAHRNRLLDLAGSEATLIVANSAAGIVYCSGYRSMGFDTDPGQRMAVVFDADEWILVGPTADLWAAAECSGGQLRYHGYGRFFFAEAAAQTSAAVEFAPFDSFGQALSAAIDALAGGKRHIAIEARPPGLPVHLEAIESGHAEALFRTARATKDPIEIGLLRAATKATERALACALADARVGMMELEIAAVISSEMIRAGLRPGFIVVTSGERAAFADAHASRRRIGNGDLLRLDVGGTLDGYWSDTARTAVAAEPGVETQAVDAAIAAGQRWALAHVAPGVTTDAIFRGTVEAVRQAGLPDYRRHHVGHGLGLESHEYPTIGPASPVRLDPGMVVNVETPYYRPGWGGIMYEDTLLVTDSGAERLTTSEPAVVILPA